MQFVATILWTFRSCSNLGAIGGDFWKVPGNFALESQRNRNKNDLRDIFYLISVYFTSFHFALFLFSSFHFIFCFILSYFISFHFIFSSNTRLCFCQGPVQFTSSGDRMGYMKIEQLQG